MATKWKSFTQSGWTKTISAVLIVAMSAVFAWQVAALARSTSQFGLDLSMLWGDEPQYEDLTDESYSSILWLLNSTYTKSTQQDIAAGNTLSDNEIADTLYNLFYDSYYDGDGVYPALESDADALTDEQITKWVNLLREEINSQELRTWLEENRGAYTAAKQQVIAQQLSDYDNQMSENALYSDAYDYYASCKETNTVTTSLNTQDAETARSLLSSYPLIITRSTAGDTIVWSSTDAGLQNYLQDHPLSFSTNTTNYPDLSADDTLIVALKPETLSNFQTGWSVGKSAIRQHLPLMCMSALVGLLCLILLCCGAGRSTANDRAHLIGFDRIWTEAQLAAGIVVVTAWVGVQTCLSYYDFSIPDRFLYLTVGISTAACVAALLALLLSQIRRIKTRCWLDGFLIWRLLYRYLGHAFSWLLRQFRKGQLRHRVIAVCILAPLLCIFWFTIPFVIAGLLYASLRALDRFDAVADGARDIRAGKTGTHITVEGGKELKELADNLNGISDGLDDAVSTAVKSERLKAELISNVSHDIKTPLTSIITYVDLLKKCDLTDPAAREYIDILDQKSQRLRILTSDLFDASKASSGAMKVDLMKTDFDALLRQALGERAEHLEKAKLDVRIVSQPPVYVNADGRLLWRILDNLIANCARYALPGSRVYITISPGTDLAMLTMKNISAAELNIPAEELMERFTRGDRSRHTDGSGLGLSIANSLAGLMGGVCRVEIDGDLFKAIVTIPMWKQPQNLGDNPAQDQTETL